MKNSTKASNQMHHFMKRMIERWGIHVSEGLYNTLVLSIRNRKSYVLEAQGCKTIHVVRCSNRLIPVVYDKKRKVLVSALPKWVLNKMSRRVRNNIEKKKPWKKATKRVTKGRFQKENWRRQRLSKESQQKAS